MKKRFLHTIIAGVLLASITFSLLGEASGFSFVAFAIFFQQVAYFLFQVGHGVPLRGLFGVFFTLQLLMGPGLVYNGFEEYQGVYFMRVSEEVYFAYALPAVSLFLVGLHIFKKKGEEAVQVEDIKDFVAEHKGLAVRFIVAGVAASLFSGLAPGELRFVFYLVGGFKFIGLFILLVGDRQLSWKLMAIVYGSIFISSFATGMFHDLMTWTIFLGLMVAVRYRPSMKVRVLSAIGLAFLAIFIQSVKFGLRSKQAEGINTASVETVRSVTEDVSTSRGGFLSRENLAPQITRINQGWIVASIMNNVPLSEPHTEGGLLKKYVEAAFMPRFLAPNKLKAGDREIFNRYSGVYLSEGTSMGLSSLGDGYIEYGFYGGWLYMFFYGFLFNMCIKRLGKLSSRLPILMLFAPLIFIYPIRPDCETQTVLGHLIKAGFLVWATFKFFILPKQATA